MDGNGGRELSPKVGCIAAHIHTTSVLSSLLVLMISDMVKLFLDMPQKDPCQKQACEIQKCLQANNYMESKCQAVIQELRKCCARYPKGRSLVCSGFENEEEEKLTLKPTAK
ncbi:cx9C motif-containing protein 4 isoform X1 [Panthera pardus]|uniref:Cx9C motif-containing protein 4 n=10 Tax=Felidae TaxID=9681 RepID=A0ABI7VUX7_FELCA|nr:cx9C motif-containing protein 4 isoform X1 [Felis catus]XP_019294907.1 cx9C motif-containing protein 4 isoform X1 [Panthera pardus]XP_026908991.1 cx9C motif-containing protein 4 isoform X1 [Acinonyx jubatus]XP_030161599.1 cx9C motif-containing protein 4 isoform X1 [Lynx canadensis]XP_045328161.1 cx9C motif-containing protein 4 isoform X1 [Leopardus geoffroyi]